MGGASGWSRALGPALVATGSIAGKRAVPSLFLGLSFLTWELLGAGIMPQSPFFLQYQKELLIRVSWNLGEVRKAGDIVAFLEMEQLRLREVTGVARVPHGGRTGVGLERGPRASC